MITCQICGSRSTGALCHTHATDLRRMLTELSGSLDERTGRATSGWIENLADAAHGETRIGNGGGSRRGGNDESPIRFNGKASGLLRQVQGTLARWVQDITEHRGLTYEPVRFFRLDFIGPLQVGSFRGVRYASYGAGLALWLNEHVGAVLASEDAGMCFLEIKQAIDAIQSRIDLPNPPKLWGRCMAKHEDRDCATAIYGRRDAVEITCPTCRTVYNAESLFNRNINASEYMHFTREELIGNQRTQESERYWTGLMGDLGEFIHYKQFQRWVKDGTIRPRRYRRPNGRQGLSRHNEADVPMYLLADVRRVRREHADKRVKVGI